MDLGVVIRPTDLGVLAEADVCEWAPGPKCFQVSEARPVNARALQVRINVFPCPLLIGRIKEDAVQSADIRSGSDQFFDLITQTPGRAPIVVIPMDNDFTLGFSGSPIAFLAKNRFARQPEVTDPFVWRHPIAN